MNYVVMIIESVLFAVAMIIGIISLREAQKARRDTFLPIIVAYENFYCTVEQCGVWFRNLGHGIALDVEARLTGVQGLYTQKCMEPSDKIDKYVWTFGLRNTEIYTKKVNNIIFSIKYKDVFGRQIETSYNVLQEKTPEGTYLPHINWNSQKIKLP